VPIINELKKKSKFFLVSIFCRKRKALPITHECVEGKIFTPLKKPKKKCTKDQAGAKGEFLFQ